MPHTKMSSTPFFVAVVLAAFVVSPAGAADVSKVRVGEGSLTLPTYAWHDDVNPVFAQYEGRIYYPYTRQDLIDKTSAPRTYKALFMENEYLRITCLPELGGRIHSVFDKTTNEEMFHKNDVIKPALIAMRGAWISGGIEWNVGPQGHTVTIVSPVDALLLENEDGSATLVVGNTEKMFRTRWTVRLTLHPGKAYLDEEIRLFNPTDGIHPYYFWNNTAFPNLPGTRFIYPMTLGTDHSGSTFYSWPVYQGKDLSWLKNYETMSSIFAYYCAFDFFGAYDVDRDRGIVSYANHHELIGKKAWTWGKDDFAVVSQMSLSDAGPDQAQYIEVQSGPLLTQADYGMLEPHQEVTWREFWYPVHGLGDGFEYATRDVAVQTFRRAGEGAVGTGQEPVFEVRFLATGSFPEAVCELSRNGRPLLTRKLDLSPLEAQSVLLSPPPADPIDISVRSREGDVLVAYTSPLNIPAVQPPDASNKPALPEAEREYQAAYLADRQSKPAEARKGYEKALAVNPAHAPSLLALAFLDIEEGRFKDATAAAAKLVELEGDLGMGWYLRGVAQLALGDYEKAVAYGYRAAHTQDAASLGYGLAGRALMRLERYDKALEAFRRARRNVSDTRTRDLTLAALYATHNDGLETQCRLAVSEDPTDFIPRAVLGLLDGGRMAEFVRDLRHIAGEDEFTFLETAAFFSNLGLYDEAARILKAAYVDARPPAAGPLPFYYLAYYTDKAGKHDTANDYLAKAAALPIDYVFPSRLEAFDALTYALDAQPADAHAHLLLGHLAAAYRRDEEAVRQWRRAVDLDPKLSVGWRLLGLHAWKTENNPAKAEPLYRKAIQTRPNDQIAYRDLAEILTKLDKRPEAIKLMSPALHQPTPRYDVILWLADAYVAEKRFDECIDLLETARFSNWEGQTRPRDVFVTALMQRGRKRFAEGRYKDALKDFQTALTYPENLEVGARYKLTDAETRYWLGKTFLELGERTAARAAWSEGAAQVTLDDLPLPFIPVTPTQDEYVKRCATALEVLEAGGPEP